MHLNLTMKLLLEHESRLQSHVVRRTAAHREVCSSMLSGRLNGNGQRSRRGSASNGMSCVSPGELPQKQHYITFRAEFGAAVTYRVTVTRNDRETPE